MPSQQLVEIILKAQDQASATAKKVDESLKNVADDFDEDLARMDEFNDLLDEVYPDNFDELSDAADRAGQEIHNLESSTKKTSSALQNIKTGALDKVGTAASKVGNGFSKIKTTLSNAFNSAKGSVTNFANTLKGKVSGAIDGVRSKLSSFSNGAKSAAGGLNFLKGAASMTVGMIGYDLVSSLVESTRASMNARQGIQAFGSRLNMSGTEVSKFQADLDKLQGTFKKVDMDVVGQQAMDMAYRLGLPKTSLTQLTETSAIFTDAMQRNGRSAEDATLALADAMDGEFKRLKEIGISQDDLMKNGWSGDINDKTGLLTAMNKALKDQHYDELAKSVDTLDDAWQVLSITLSNLLESVLLPITPAIVGVINGIVGLINGLKSAWNGLPDFAQLGIGIGLVAGAIVVVASVLWSTYIPAWVAAATATWAALAPILPIVLAVAAVVGILVAVVYEVGKAFGWWYDVDSMLAAIRTGLARLWAAFINHPDVQAAISMISSALSTLWGWIQQAGKAVLEFFGISTSNKFYLVSTLINNVSKSWEMLKGAASTVIGVLQSIYSAAVWIGQGVYNALKPIVCILLGCSPGIVPALQMVYSMFTTVWNAIAGYVSSIISPIVETIQSLVDVFVRFATGQMDVLSVISAVGSTLWNLWLTLSANLSVLVLTLVGNLLTWATQAGLNVLTGLSTYLIQVPTRVALYLAQVLSRIISYGARWVAQGRAKASQLLNGIVSFLRQLPGRALSALLGVVSSIVSAGAQWVSNARSKASQVVSNVTSTLSGLPGKISSALSGVVSAITKPFKDAYNTLTGIVDNIKSKAAEVGNISLPFGGDLPMGGDLEPVSANSSVVYNANGNTIGSSDVLTVDINQNVTLDLSGVPAHIDTNTLIGALQNREVLRALVENRDFQSIDAQVKERINYKVNRSRGI